MEPTETSKQDQQAATIEALASALNVRDHCIAGQAALIAQLMAEIHALRGRLMAAAKED